MNKERGECEQELWTAQLAFVSTFNVSRGRYAGSLRRTRITLHIWYVLKLYVQAETQL